MKIFISIIFLLFASSCFALNIEQSWDFKFQKNITLTCQDEYACSDFCDDENKCVIKEKYCRDCVGSSIYIINIFQQMGRIYVNSGEEVLEVDFLEFLREGSFVSFTSKSVYDHLGLYNEEKKQKMFRSLCPYEESKYPVVFFNLKKASRKIDRVKYVACNTKEDIKIFKMSNQGNLI